MELLALLKRLAPLLGRVVPMLEMFVATRGTAHAATDAMESLAADMAQLKEKQGDAARRHDALSVSLAEQSTTLSTLQQDIRHVREADERGAARLLELETQVSALTRSARSVKQLLLAVLAVCFVLLALLLALLLRHTQ